MSSLRFAPQGQSRSTPHTFAFRMRKGVSNSRGPDWAFPEARSMPFWPTTRESAAETFGTCAERAVIFVFNWKMRKFRRGLSSTPPGKLSRFTKRSPPNEFGVQYTSRTRGLAFSTSGFIDDAYGGAFPSRAADRILFPDRRNVPCGTSTSPDCRVTGPVAYDRRVPGEFIAIGDAAGMLDPFCGEGMRHAMETGTLAARIVAAGIRREASYEEMSGNTKPSGKDNGPPGARWVPVCGV